ncbi:hypothetical protein GCM10009678_66620 [Actinomadura kijaniata]
MATFGRYTSGSASGFCEFSIGFRFFQNSEPGVSGMRTAPLAVVSLRVNLPGGAPVFPVADAALCGSRTSAPGFETFTRKTCGYRVRSLTRKFSDTVEGMAIGAKEGTHADPAVRA